MCNINVSALGKSQVDVRTTIAGFNREAKHASQKHPNYPFNAVSSVLKPIMTETFSDSSEKVEIIQDSLSPAD